MICLFIDSLIWLSPHQRCRAEQGLDARLTSVFLCGDQSNDLVQTNCSMHFNNFNKLIIVKLCWHCLFLLSIRTPNPPWVMIVKLLIITLVPCGAQAYLCMLWLFLHNRSFGIVLSRPNVYCARSLYRSWSSIAIRFKFTQGSQRWSDQGISHSGFYLLPSQSLCPRVGQWSANTDYKLPLLHFLLWLTDILLCTFWTIILP